TSCSQPIGPGLVRGDFEVIAGESREGGPLCPVYEEPCEGCLKIVKYKDKNGDGEKDKDEPLLEGWQFTVTNDEGYLWTGTTDEDGKIVLTGLTSGWYTVEEDTPLPDGWINTEPGGDPPYTQRVEITCDRGGRYDDCDPVYFGNNDEEGLCGECEGKVTTLTLKYLGTSEAHIEVETKDGVVVFDGTVNPAGEFSFSGNDNKGTLGTKIKIYVNDKFASEIHTSCSQPIGPGLIKGDFEVIAGESREGGPLCPLSE
ncbi:collagen binding domain-containing protein, partial [Chloroflexota bacterium]